MVYCKGGRGKIHIKSAVTKRMREREGDRGGYEAGEELSVRGDSLHLRYGHSLHIVIIAFPEITHTIRSPQSHTTVFVVAIVASAIAMGGDCLKVNRITT